MLCHHLLWMSERNKQDTKRGSGGRAEKRRFGIDHATGRLCLGSFHLPMPKSRPARIVVGSMLIVGGVLGFLPILGFWMLPLGFIVLSQDLAPARRLRRRLAVWWQRRNRPIA